MNKHSCNTKKRIYKTKIENVDTLEHRNGLGGIAGSIVASRAEQNTWDVDAVPGGAFSSEQ